MGRRCCSYRGPDYTALATAYDVFVTPQPQAGTLAGARNITLQEVCPGRMVEHMAIALDALAYELARDAIAHPGPAEPSRLAAGACGRQHVAGSRPERLSHTAFGALSELEKFDAGHGEGEPRLRCHLDRGCAKPRLRPRLRVHWGSRRITGRLVLPPGALNQCDGAVTVRFGTARRTVPLTLRCTFTARLSPRGTRRGSLIAGAAASQ